MLKRSFLASWLCLAAALSVVALADAAPEQLYPGSSINTPVPTQVQMASEQVVLTLVRGQPPANDKEFYGSDSGWLVKVQADFQMRAADKTEQMTVRFPLEDVQGYTVSPSLLARDLKAYVNGKEVPTREVTSKTPDDNLIRWAGFDVTFPAGKVTHLRVTYSAIPQAEGPVLGIGYILETGAGWAGKIGQADLTVKLPYPATKSTVLNDSGTYYLDPRQTLPGGKLVGNEVRWRLSNLEPTSKDNLQLAILNPDIIASISRARAKASTGQLSDLKRLTQALAAAITVDPTIDPLTLTKEQAVGLKPLLDDPYFREWDKAVAQLETRAKTDTQARLAVIEAVLALPNPYGRSYFTPDQAIVLRALRQLDALRKAPSPQAIQLFSQLQQRVFGPLILPSAQTEQAQVTPEETIRALAKLADLKSAADLPATNDSSPCYGYTSPLSPKELIGKLNVALFQYGRPWLGTSTAEKSTWEKEKDEWTNNFSSLNGKKRFEAFIKQFGVGSSVCFRYVNPQYPIFGP